MQNVEDPFLELEQSLGFTPERPAGNFDEAAYLRAFPDIAAAVKRGQWKSAHHHFQEYGAAEGRITDQRYLRALTAQIGGADVDAGQFPPCGVDVAFATGTGMCLVIGWVDDRSSPLEAVTLTAAGLPRGLTRHAARCRRPDAERAVGLPAGHLVGFWALIAVSLDGAATDRLAIRISIGTKSCALPVKIEFVTDGQFRDTVFEYAANVTYFGNPSVESFFQLDRGQGQFLLGLNGRMSAAIKARAYAERYGPDRPSYRGSIIVCLYGKAEFLFLQSALFAAGRNAAEYEFIYVCNSPELTEVLQKEATIAERIYGLSQTLVFLPGNAGFGAANNVAAEFARSDRIMIVNPDVFPRDAGWADRHSQILDGLPSEQTDIFGAPLFYEDGSLMHAGMFFEVDTGLSVKPEGIVGTALIRVEHYAKGAPPGTALYHRSRAVPALTGAFISADRAWFEKLGGFSEEYVFGHYEDADLCLKSRAQGRPVWLHDLPLWHLEGKGSVRNRAHEGGSLVNRWHFTRTWGDFIAAEFATAAQAPARSRAVVR